MNPTWVFVIASIIAVIGITVVFKQLITAFNERLDRGENLDQHSLEKDFKSFFTKIGLVESVPIILIVVGFIIMDRQTETIEVSSILLPILVIAIALLFGIINVLLVKKATFQDREIKTSAKNFINTIFFIWISIISAIPIISVIAMFMMTA